MSATGKGVEWERGNSLWVWLTLPIVGYWTWAVFLYIGVRAQHKRWIFWGFAYLSPFLIVLPFLPDVQRTGEVPLSLILICAAFVIAGPIHAFSVKRDYLMRLAALEQLEERETQEQKKKTESAQATQSDGARPKRNQTHKAELNLEAAAQEVLRNEAKVQAAPVSEVDSTAHPEPSSHTPATSNTEPTSTTESSPSVLPTLVEPDLVTGTRTLTVVRINHDPPERMAQMPEIGLILATKIALIREERGGFHSFEEFVEVMELSPRFAERLRPFLVFE